MNEHFLIDDDDRYARLRMIAWWDQDRLARAQILVVGAGALGNEVLKNLALVGVGRLYVVDCDRIESSNLTRSVLFRRRDCGRAKAEVAAEAVRDLNPDVQVRAWHGDIMTDVGLGVFRDVDVVIACLDNREARLWVNRQCWKVATPWIDGGIQEINGVVKVFVPPDSACYECVMTENDYRLINLRYSCPLLRREDLLAGRVPTAPTIASMIGGLQAQEALKLLHGLPVDAGHAWVYNGVANQFYRTRFPRRDDCLSHETYPPPLERPLSARHHTATDLFGSVGADGSAGGEPRLELDRDLVVSLTCAPCGWERPLLRPLSRVSLEAARCAACGQTAKPQLEHVIPASSPWANETLAALGVASYDIVRVCAGGETTPVLLAGDRDDMLQS